jgi:hypothetical protein
MKGLILFLVVVAVPASARECLNLALSSFRVVGKMEPKKYEIAGSGRNALLFTTKTEFKKEGPLRVLLSEDSGKVKSLWIDAKPEKMKVRGRNGFEMQVEVAKESEECEKQCEKAFRSKAETPPDVARSCGFN